MKTFLASGIALALLTLSPYALACGGDHAANSSSNSKETLQLSQAAPVTADSSQATVKIKGMMCASCEKKIQSSLLKLPGVQSVAISRKTGTAQVTYAKDSITPEKIAEAVRGLGYKVVL